MRTLVCALALALLAAPTPAWSGEAPLCHPAPTLATNVAAAPVIVVARARSRTRRLKPDRLRTRFAVERVLKGHLARRRITVGDCWGYKCASALFHRGDRVVLFLHPAARRGHYWLPGVGCSNGVFVAAVRYRPADPRVRRIFALTGHPLRRRK